MKKKKATTYVIGNFKGGVAKTKIATMLAFDNAMIEKKKTLFIDLDPQANGTQILARTANIETINTTINDGILADDLSICVTPVMENLDMIACDTSFRSFTRYVATQFETEHERVHVLAKLLEPLKNNYDSIFIDVPPTISEFSDNAMAAADYSLIAFQTQEESLEGVNTYINYQNHMVETFNTQLQVLAIIPCMLRTSSMLDLEVMNRAKDLYGDVLTPQIVRYQERLKRYSSEGISLKQYEYGPDRWDFKAHQVFIQLLHEMNNRQLYLEGIEEDRTVYE